MVNCGAPGFFPVRRFSFPTPINIDDLTATTGDVGRSTGSGKLAAGTMGPVQSIERAPSLPPEGSGIPAQKLANMSDESWRPAPILGVRNVRQTAEYYRDILGFRLDPVNGVFQPSADEPGGVYAIVKRGGAWIHFQIRRGELPNTIRQPLERDVYLYVNKLDSLYGELQHRGAKIIQPPRAAPYGLRELVVEDLNGYRLTFGEELP
jgi:uncharacterized glyoxalase superfamily protein PhnB